MKRGEKMKNKVAVIAVLSVSFIMGCSSSSNNTPKATPVPAVEADNKNLDEGGDKPKEQSSSSASGAEVAVDLSADAKSDGVTIKRLSVGQATMDVLDPNPKGIDGARQDGSLILALCAPRIDDENLNELADAAYPIIISSHSQVLLRRDLSYRFGDGTNALSAPPYVLMTCQDPLTVNKGKEPLSGKTSSSQVQVKRLRLGDVAMDTLNPNPKGVGNSSQPGNLVLVFCGPRITDETLGAFKGSAYPILMTARSQIALKRDTGYRFGDGTSASSLTPEVVYTCEYY
jgi:hypothetical protein